MRNILDYTSFLNESQDTDEIKLKLQEMFPEIEDLEYMNKGMFGHAFMGTIDNNMVVAKLTNSITEYWLTQMAIVSDPPHTAKFYDAKEFPGESFKYGIVHDYVNKDAMPDKKIWDMVSSAAGPDDLDQKYSKLNNKEERYEFNLARKHISEVMEYFGLKDMDTLHQNWGYDNNRNLVMYDLDGNVNKGAYTAWMSKHKGKINESVDVYTKSEKYRRLKSNKSFIVYRGISPSGTNFYKGKEELPFTYYSLRKEKAEMYGDLNLYTFNKDEKPIKIFFGKDLYDKFGMDHDIENPRVYNVLIKEGYSAVLIKGDELVVYDKNLIEKL